MKLNQVKSDPNYVALAACKTANCWKKIERNCKTTETNDAASHC